MIDLDDLLQKTSRTFALSIPLLTEPLRRQISMGYLLFRIADTLEDEGRWPVEQRITLLGQFPAALLDAGSPESLVVESLCASAEVDDPGYRELLREWPGLAAEFRLLDPEPREVVHRNLRGTVDGMCRFLRKRPADLGELRDYCYRVAGIVGEMCTELFVLHRPELACVKRELMDRSAAFGEGLQLVNVLRDEDVDAGQSRRFIPGSVGRGELTEIAWRDLERAVGYVELLEAHGALDVVAFNAINLALAIETLAQIESDGPGAKMTGERVFGLIGSISDGADEAGSVVALLRRSLESRRAGSRGPSPILSPRSARTNAQA